MNYSINDEMEGEIGEWKSIVVTHYCYVHINNKVFQLRFLIIEGRLRSNTLISDDGNPYDLKLHKSKNKYSIFNDIDFIKKSMLDKAIQHINSLFLDV